MGILSKRIRYFLSPKFAAKDFVKSIEESYELHKTKFPGYDPHFYLAQTWLAYKKSHGFDPEDKDQQLGAFSWTYLIACVNSQRCARALGIYILYKERPGLLEAYTPLKYDFNELIMPVLRAMEDGSAPELYKRNNPKMDGISGSPAKGV